MVLGYEYNILLAPINTEKTTKQAEENKYSFYVLVKATKEDIKKAVESIFNVEVEDVNVINTKGKKKVFRSRKGQRSDRKKAIISVKKGQEINLSKLG